MSLGAMTGVMPGLMYCDIEASASGDSGSPPGEYEGGDAGVDECGDDAGGEVVAVCAAEDGAGFDSE